MSPLYRPVPQSLNISTAAGVKDYFPNLAQVTGDDIIVNVTRRVTSTGEPHS
jgi:hypothetical protein